MFSSNGTQVAGAGGAFIEDVFNTFLYKGTGSTQTITNGINLSANGGLVWIKSRNNMYGHSLYDTVRGRQYKLATNSTAAQAGPSGASNDLTSFNTDGFTLDVEQYSNTNSDPARTYVAWTFRKQKKFFDIVTWTGNYPTNYPRVISHNLDSVPGFITIKRVTNVQGQLKPWNSYHRSISTGDYNANQTVFLNTTASAVNYGNQAGPFTSTTFEVGEDLNASGETYIAYLFAHNAGGFGLSGTDNAISCGSYTGSDVAEVSVNLGYEPQWLLIKRTTNAGDAYRGWTIFDNLRGIALEGNNAALIPDTSDSESPAEATAKFLYPTSTGFNLYPGYNRTSAGTNTYIYVAIRRGPMRAPTVGTSVFKAVARAGTSSATTHDVTPLNSPDMIFTKPRGDAGNNWSLVDRLRGGVAGSGRSVQPNTTNVEDSTQSMSVFSDQQTKISFGGAGNNQGISIYIVHCFKRAAGFFDIVCYTGTGSARTISHNLTVAPEMVIIKSRSAAYAWPTLVNAIGSTDFLFLNTNSAKNSAASYFNSTYPTASVFSVGTNVQVNESGSTFVAYLFATCAGVSKVGSYTGTGTTQQINCGFTAGARFVLIKRYDGGSTGDWYLWDASAGIVTGDDPYQLLNTTDAQVTTTDYIDPYSAGFEISSTAPAAINASGGSFIFLAIA